MNATDTAVDQLSSIKSVDSIGQVNPYGQLTLYCDGNSNVNIWMADAECVKFLVGVMRNGGDLNVVVQLKDEYLTE